MVLKIIISTITALTIVNAIFEPGIKVGSRYVNSRKDSAKQLHKLLVWASKYPKTSSFVREIPVKPGAGIESSFQMKTEEGPYIFKIYTNGDIAYIGSGGGKWHHLKNQEELNSMYKYFREVFDANIDDVGTEFKSSDFKTVVKAVGKLPKAVKNVTP